MKNAFENNLKQSLDNFEMPYDSAAWTAMQSRLDATASTPSFEEKMKEGLNANEYPYNPAAWSAMSKRLDKGDKGGFKKWYYAAAIIGAAAITTAILWNSDSKDTTSEKKNAISVAENTSDKKASSNQSTDIEKNNSETKNNGADLNVENSNNSNSNTNSSNQTSTSIPSNDPSSNQGVSQQGTGTEPNSSNGGNNGSTTVIPPNGGNDHTNGQVANTPAWKYIAPAIPEMVCEGESIQIQNDNEYPLAIIYPNGLNWIGNENQVTRLNPSIAGTYKIGYLRRNKFKEQSTFVVSERPTADIDFVDLSQKYLNGLPTIEVRSNTSAAKYVWEYENGKVYGENAGLHFYDAGLHLVRLTVTNDEGCSASVEKPVNVTEDYNLMAVNAFYPTGNDRSTNTFMPYALTERNVAFKMIIVDPNDGHTLYETSDASAGWNGIDQQTGSLVDLEKSYIWKVTVLNPEKGEDNVYAGTILTLPQ